MGRARWRSSPDDQGDLQGMCEVVYMIDQLRIKLDRGVQSITLFVLGHNLIYNSPLI